jgi:tetratricopeptide (TPR) repeat protein
MYSKAICLFLIYLVSFVAHAEWAPAQPVDPLKILNSAVKDRQSGNYQRALDKHMWFHHNVLDYDQSFYGVRLSFALSYWVDLSKEFEPALIALENEAAEAEARLRYGDMSSLDDFHDFVAIHRELGNSEPVLDLFLYFDVENSQFAAQNIDIVGPFLIEAEKYTLYTKYLDPVRDFEKAKDFYQMNIEMSEDSKYGADFREYADDNFIEKVTTMIALFAITGKQDVADQVAKKSLRVMRADKLKKRVASALEGEVPRPWL